MMVNKEYTLGPAHLKFTLFELIFDIYSLGWVLDEIASVLEHGWTVHTENLWSFLDITFVGQLTHKILIILFLAHADETVKVLIFLSYFGVRCYGFTHSDNHSHAQLAANIISMAAPILLPRLAFCLMPENMLFISLRAMMSDFMFLTLLAGWCFGGFLMALRWLSESQDGSVPEDHSLLTIAKWMLWIWFGLDGTGVQRAGEMHWLLGPTLMILFAFLGNTRKLVLIMPRLLKVVLGNIAIFFLSP